MIVSQGIAGRPRFDQESLLAMIRRRIPWLAIVQRKRRRRLGNSAFVDLFAGGLQTIETRVEAAGLTMTRTFEFRMFVLNLPACLPQSRSRFGIVERPRGGRIAAVFGISFLRSDFARLGPLDRGLCRRRP